MSKFHMFGLSVLAALAGIAGLATFARTAGYGQPQRSTAPAAGLAAREQALEQQQAELRRALRKKPPPLPAVPAAPRVSVPARRAVALAAPASDRDDDDHDEFEAGDDD